MFGMTLEQNSKKELARAINTLTNKLYTLACKIATPLKTIQLIQFVDVAPIPFFFYQLYYVSLMNLHQCLAKPPYQETD